MQTAKVNDAQLAYSVSGEGPDLVFSHGIPTDYRAWNAQIGPFSMKYRTLTYSRRLAQPNDNTRNFLESTIENNSKDLEEFIQKTTSPPVNLVGHSYGGFIAAYLAANHPDLVKRLVLIEPGASTLLIQDPESRSQMLSLLFRSPSVALAAGTYLRRYYNPMLDAYHKSDLDTALTLFLDGLMNQTGALARLPEKVQAMMRENASTIGEVEAKLPAFSKNDAKRISAPTLLVNGANGTKIFRAINEQFAKSIPNNQHIVISGATHFPHLENSASFNEKVLDFLGQN